MNSLIKIEIIINTVYLHKLMELLKYFRISDYTLMDVTNSHSSNEELGTDYETTAIFKKNYVFFVIEYPQFSLIANRLDQFALDHKAALIASNILEANINMYSGNHK